MSRGSMTRGIPKVSAASKAMRQLPTTSWALSLDMSLKNMENFALNWIHLRFVINKIYSHQMWHEVMNYCTEGHAVTPTGRQIGNFDIWIIFGNIFAPLEQILARRVVL